MPCSSEGYFGGTKLAASAGPRLGSRCAWQIIRYAGLSMIPVERPSGTVDNLDIHFLHIVQLLCGMSTSATLQQPSVRPCMQALMQASAQALQVIVQDYA